MRVKQSVAIILSTVFASLSLILSLGYCWAGLTVTYMKPLTAEIKSIAGWLIAPGWFYNLLCVTIALFFIVIALCAKVRQKRVLLVATLMLIPGILILIHSFLLFIAFGRM